MLKIDKMNRIAILGCAGCGKSTLASKLGQKKNIPVLHLDTIYWKANWIEEEKDVFYYKQVKFLENTSWIIDGNYRDTLDLRLKDADTIIYLDYPRRVAIFGIYKRYFQYRNKQRDSIAAGCKEKIDRSFFKWVWNFKKNAKPVIMEKVKEYSKDKNVFIFKNRKELNKFLKDNNI